MMQRSLGQIGAAVRGIVATGGTNAAPIVATLTAGHGLKNGDRITITGVTGLTAMNGDWTVAAAAATTIALEGSVGNGTFGGTPVIAVRAIAPRSCRATRRSPGSTRTAPALPWRRFSR